MGNMGFSKDSVNGLVSAAVEMFKTKEIRPGKAAEIAGVSVIEFKEILAGSEIIKEVGSGSKGGHGKKNQKIKGIEKIRLKCSSIRLRLRLNPFKATP